MISSLDEFESAKQLVNECVGALQYEGIEHNGSPAIGMMVEIPSVLDLIDSFADIADFFSIGTNDFTQYMLAADRTNEKVAGYYQPCHPAVLRALKRLVDAAAAHGREISVCGDMAHDIRYLPFLIGIGVRVLSVEPIYLPVIQRAIEHIDLADARQIASRLVSMTRLRNVEELIDQNGQSEVIPWR
jgi:phosphotransferase system enzyme I (PtsP)